MFTLRTLTITVLFLFVGFVAGGQSVDPLTGRAIVNLPLGEIKALDLSASVSLSHHGGALKVNEGPGNAGMGWQVYMGGVVSREVRGLPDDYSKAADNRTGWLVNSNANAALIQGFTSSSDDNLDICTDEEADWNFMNGLNYIKDTEPDIYYFSAPGLSGKFVFGSDGLPKLVPYQDLQITYTLVASSTAIASFTIKNNAGMVYTFASTTNMTRQAYGTSNTTNNMLYQQPATFTLVWNLTSVESKATGAIANFTYLSTPKMFNTIFNGTNDLSHVNVAVDTLNKIREAISPKRLSQVTLKNYSMNIEWSNNLVDKITVSESESGSTQEFDLVYQSVTSTTDTSLPKIAKPFLVEIKQQNPTMCEALPSYKFDYTDVDLVTGLANIPWRTGYGEDFFGYYNGVNNSVNIPTLYFYPSEEGGKRYRVHPIPGGTPQVINAPNSGSMGVNGAYTAFGSLKRITLPTGGTTTYQYELNKYFDSSTTEEFNGPGVRVASVTTFGGEQAYAKLSATSGYHAITTKYEYINAGSVQTSGKVTFPPAFGFTRGSSVSRVQSDWTEGTELYYGRVTEFIVDQNNAKYQGYREYIFDLPNMYPDPTATKSKIAREPGSTCTGTLFKNGAYGYPFAPLKDFGYTRGLPLSVTEYDASGNKTMQRTNTYTIVPSGVVVKGLRYEWLANGIFNFSLYEIPVSEAKLITKEVVRTYGEETPGSFAETTTDYVYDANNLLTQSTQTNADASVLRSFVKYAKDFNITTPAVNDQQASAIFKLNSNNRGSEVIETYQTFKPTGGTEIMAGAQLNLYKDYGTYVAPYQSQSFAQETIALPVGGILSSSNATNFTPHASYKVKGAISEWVNGLPVNQTSPYNLVSTGVHYSTGTAMALATFANAKAEHAVYEGFEFVQTRGLTYSGTGAVLQNNGRAGKKSLQIASTNATVTSTSLVTKKENSYRISGWILAAANATLTVQAKNGATVQSTATLNYTTPGQWKYLEVFMNTTPVSATFSLSLSANTTLQLDDFVAIPKSARVSYSSGTPFIGTTDQVDDRGNSAKGEFDSFARPTKSYDRNGNLREVREYALQRTGRVELNCSFSTNVTQYVVGQGVLFTASSQPSCLSPVTYTWSVKDPNNNSVPYSGSSITHTFTTYGMHTVTLTVSTTVAGYQPVTFTENVCVVFPDPLVLNVTVDNATILRCSPTTGAYRVFNAVFPNLDPAVTTNLNYSYSWYVMGPSGVWALVAITSTVSPMYNPYNPSQALPANQFMYLNPQNSYQLTCVASMMTNLLHAPIANSSCNDQATSVQLISPIQVTYVDNSINGACP